MPDARIVVVGDAVLDQDVQGRSTRLCPDAPVPVVDVDDRVARAGGAGLTAVLAARLDRVADVVLVAPVADDPDGLTLRAALTGVRLMPLGHRGPTRTKTRIRSGGQTLLRLDAGGPGEPMAVDEGEVRQVLAGAEVIVVSDYGAGTTRDPVVRGVLAEAARTTPVVWDPHPRGGDPVPGCALVAPNLAEARRTAAALGMPEDATEATLADALRSAWSADAVAVTLGERGAWLVDSAGSRLVPTVGSVSGDTCGAGDRFTAAAAAALGVRPPGTDLESVVSAAVAAASAWVAGGGASGFALPDGVGGGDPLAAQIAEVRRRGGTVVATGGCFDLLHVGHIRYLAAARGLGDMLVVLLNSDDSVRRLKGTGRPLMHQADREQMLTALACVDAVVVFEEDDPRLALERLRPDVWVKGGDYRADELPESPLVRSWGGRVSILPFVPERSTTRLLERVRHAG